MVHYSAARGIPRKAVPNCLPHFLLGFTVGVNMQEIWKSIPEYEGMYEVSNLGRVKSLARHRIICNKKYLYPEKFLKQIDRGNGYLCVGLCKSGKTKLVSVHRAMLIAFVGDQPDMFACHNNGNLIDNRLENLRWDTPKANMADRVKHGTDIRGEKHSKAKLTIDDVQMIRSNASSAAEIARKLGVSDACVLNVRNYKTWVHV